MDSRPSIDELLGAESGMDNSFAICATAFLAKIGWAVVMHLMGSAAYGWPGSVDAALLLGLLGAYIWFAISVARVAARLGKRALAYLAWILGAPLLGSLLGVPFFSDAISASPLSLKWLLGSEIRAIIRARTLAD